MGKEENNITLDRYLNGVINKVKKKIEIEKSVNEILKNIHYHHLLLKISRLINTPQEFNQLLELIVDSAITLSKAERGFLMLIDKDGCLEFKVTRNIDKKTLISEKFEISRTIVNEVMATGKPLFLSDIYKEKNFKISKSIEVLGLHMVMCVPLRAKENILGLIYVDSRAKTESFTRVEERIFEAFAAQASIAIENRLLYDLSVHDALTGLYNYGYLRMRLDEEIIRAAGSRDRTISFIMLDLDNFKSINDSYGHLLGNSILIRIAQLIRDEVRKYDVAARFGGDEFAILMPDTDIDNVKNLANRFQKAIADLKFSVAQKAISLTASIGISIFPIEKIVDSESIIIEADHALFVAKAKGGNQIALFGLRKERIKHAPELIGTSRVINEVRNTIAKLARTDVKILIIGETGTGKELVSRLLHSESDRADKPLIVVNCGAIPDTLLESELFGYEKGAFTGAYMQRKGKFELAHGGTIFLDEIGELPFQLQVKILRALEEKEIERIGGKLPIKLDVRVIAASNKNLEDEVRHGKFRKDLFYRLSVATIYLPPLRDRPEDIETFSDYYLRQMNKRYQKKYAGFTKNAQEALLRHFWPGNVRELIHRIERAVIMSTNEYISDQDLNLDITRSEDLNTLKETTDKTEKECIIRALLHNQWNITHAAKELGISRQNLRYLIKKHQITKS